MGDDHRIELGVISDIPCAQSERKQSSPHARRCLTELNRSAIPTRSDRPKIRVCCATHLIKDK